MQHEIFPLKKEQSLKGTLSVPPDKSIAQRAVIISSIAEGDSLIKNFPVSGDPQSTLKAIKNLGVEIKTLSSNQLNNNQENKSSFFTQDLIVKGKGSFGIKEPNNILDFENSGTGFRLTTGLLSGLENISFVCLTGDDSLKKRPMKRLINLLKELGAEIYGRENYSLAPICILGKKLTGGKIETPVASAQIKSALLLSCLQAKDFVVVKEPTKSRNHTEIMLKDFGAQINLLENNSVQLFPSKLKGKELFIPGDVSSAAFLISAACIVPNSEIKIEKVGLNSTRTGFIDCLKQMGANINIKKYLNIASQQEEIYGEIEIKATNNLKAIEIKGEIIPNVIDELPILSLVAAQAKGQTIIKDAQELRYKESDRIKALFLMLKNLGVRVEELEDGLIIEGQEGKLFNPKTTIFETYKDHRIAMTTAIAGLLCNRSIIINDSESADVSFPGFYKILEILSV